MYLTRSALSRPGVFLLVTNLLVTILKARPHGSFSTSPIKSLQHWSRISHSLPQSWFYSFPCLAQQRITLWAGKQAPIVSFFGVSPRVAERALRKIPILFESGWDSSLFWKPTPLSRRHLWVLSIPLTTSVASFTLSLTWPGLFLSIPCWMTLRALANFSIFLVCSLRSWRKAYRMVYPIGTFDKANKKVTE